VNDNRPERFPESASLLGRKRETARQEFTVRQRVLDLLRAKGPATIPEIAGELGLPTAEVTWWLMGYVRYARVKASEKADDQGYYRYALVAGK